MSLIKKIMYGLSLGSTLFFLGVLPAFAAPTLSITSPNGGETLTVGQTYRIVWNSTNVDKVSISYSQCASCLNTIVDGVPNVGYYDWKVNVGNSAATRFKIYVIGYQTGTGSMYDYSDSDFALISGSTVTSPSPVPSVAPTQTPTPTSSPTNTPIGAPFVSFVSPLGGDVWVPGNTYTITWNQKNTTRVNVYLYKGSSSQVTTLVTDRATSLDQQTQTVSFVVPSDLMINVSSWPYPVALLESNQYKIKVRADQTDFDSANFTIKKPSTVFSSTSVDGFPTPYTPRVISVTDTSISVEMDITPNGTPNVVANFDVNLKDENNRLAQVKNARISVPPVNTLYTAHATIGGLSPNTKYTLVTQAMTDQIIVSPSLGHIIDFVTKPTLQGQTISITPIPSPSIIPAPSITSTALPTVTNPPLINQSDGVSQLMQQIKILQEQLAKIQAQQQSGSGNNSYLKPNNSTPASNNQEGDTALISITVRFDHDLLFGMRNSEEVSNLQEFLIDQGFLEGSATGNYFILTQSAVKRFQIVHRIKASGYFGPITRAIANQILAGK